MKKSPVKRIKRIVHECDIILEVVDSRFPDETRYRYLKDLVKKQKKKLVLLFSKADLITKKEKEDLEERFRHTPHSFISVTKRRGKMKLIKKLLSMESWPKIKVGVVGYPNAGKSSIINYLSGRGAARTSSMPNFTKGEQWVRVSKRLLFYDTPGVIGRGETDESLALKSAKDADLVEDADLIAEKILKTTGAASYYGLEKKDPKEQLEELALKRGKLKKGGEPNIPAISKVVIRDYQKGKFR
jgi:ribosome biogenesis GTPase A